MVDQDRFPWAEQRAPRLLKSPWWIGHIPFAYELIGRQRPNTIVELGMELVEMARAPEFSADFSEKGALVFRRFEDMGVMLPVHGA